MPIILRKHFKWFIPFTYLVYTRHGDALRVDVSMALSSSGDFGGDGVVIDGLHLECHGCCYECFPEFHQVSLVWSRSTGLGIVLHVMVLLCPIIYHCNIQPIFC